MYKTKHPILKNEMGFMNREMLKKYYDFYECDESEPVHREAIASYHGTRDFRWGDGRTKRTDVVPKIPMLAIPRDLRPFQFRK